MARLIPALSHISFIVMFSNLFSLSKASKLETRFAFVLIILASSFIVLSPFLFGNNELMFIISYGIPKVNKFRIFL